jgi:thioredoxin 1
MASSQAAPPPSLLVACLCADWCGACREYKPLFDALALKLPDARFLWVDVEDHADLIDPIEVENFPSILIASVEKTSSESLFFGTVLPHIEALERLILAKQSAKKNEEKNEEKSAKNSAETSLTTAVKPASALQLDAALSMLASKLSAADLSG